MKLDTIDYKGKYFILQDKGYEDPWGMDYVTGEMDPSEFTPEFIKEHKENCDYYGIPCIITRNEGLKKLFR